MSFFKQVCLCKFLLSIKTLNGIIKLKILKLGKKKYFHSEIN